MNLATALATAYDAAATFMKNKPAYHVYPCGFAWVNYKCRKNAKEAKDLIAAGARWDDYAKAYSFSMRTATQSMDYNIEVCNAFVTSLNASGFSGFYVASRID